MLLVQSGYLTEGSDGQQVRLLAALPPGPRRVLLLAFLEGCGALAGARRGWGGHDIGLERRVPGGGGGRGPSRRRSGVTGEDQAARVHVAELDVPDEPVGGRVPAVGDDRVLRASNDGRGRVELHRYELRRGAGDGRGRDRAGRKDRLSGDPPRYVPDFDGQVRRGWVHPGEHQVHLVEAAGETRREGLGVALSLGGA